jgi:hypothetical protein
MVKNDSAVATQTLRRRLQEMTEVEDGSQHPALLDTLTRDCPNTVVLLASPHPPRRYTCAMHVFDFTEKPEYVAIAERGFNRVFAGAAFVHLLLDEGLLNELVPSDAREGDLVLYFNEEGRFKHAGLNLGNNRVLSKWGSGHLFEHGLLEVPESYGTKVRFFKRLAYSEAYDHFRRFARESGMLLDELR